MTDEERKMLKDIHAALLEVPAGSPKDMKPLLEDVRTVVRSYHRASWLTRSLIWLIPLAAGMGVAIEKIRGWF
jgi:hypothetical protein